jgi:hypothetical protein
MKRKLFKCNYCYIEKFNSETQEFINMPFSCGTLAEWKQHLKRPKHNTNVARNENLKDDLVVECKHCCGVYTKEQYKDHKQHNILLWISNNPIYNDSSCNNFIYNDKRFEDLNVLKAYAECRYDNGRKKYDYIKKPKEIKSFADRAEPMKILLDKKKEKEKALEQEKKKKQEVQATPPIENLTLSIEDQEYNQLNNIKDTKQDKHDLSIKPIWDSEDMCCECGHNTNAWKEYTIEKLELWEQVICHCDSESDESDSDSDDEKII